MLNKKYSEEIEEIVIHVSKKTKSSKKVVVNSYKGNENSDSYRLVRYSKNGELYSGIEILNKVGWSQVTSAKRELEPAMWESYWMKVSSMGVISIQEAVLRIAVYMIDVLGTMENVLIFNSNPSLAAAIRETLLEEGAE